MTRILGASLVVCLAAFGVVACSGDSGYGSSSGGGGYAGGAGVDCSAYSSCDTCTPVVGCGWCQSPDGTGTCTAGPSYCSGQEFSWTWEKAGCGVFAPSDAGADETSDGAPSTSDAAVTSDTTASSDTAPGEVSACSPPTGAAPSCTQTFGGSLCGSSEYTLSCPADGSADPQPALACVGAKVTGYFCCPCAGTGAGPR